MMYGRGFFNGGNTNFGGNGCFGYGNMGGGLNILIIIGVLVGISLLIYFLVHNNNKKRINQSHLEVLNMKYVQGEITEEEYLRRKDILNK